jgi:hypothetical protein
MIGNAALTCSGAEHDVYGRLVATCTVSGIDINEQMVADGWALAFRKYSERYVPDEVRARAAKLGLWSSSFTPPDEYRAEEREARAAHASSPRRVVAQAAPTGCVIKGNRGSHGWIYHLPGMPYYEQTRAEETFCTEAQAQAAGYRRAKVR